VKILGQFFVTEIIDSGPCFLYLFENVTGSCFWDAVYSVCVCVCYYVLLESGEVWGGDGNYIQPHSSACQIFYNAEHWIQQLNAVRRHLCNCNVNFSCWWTQAFLSTSC